MTQGALPARDADGLPLDPMAPRVGGPGTDEHRTDQHRTDEHRADQLVAGSHAVAVATAPKEIGTLPPLAEQAAKRLPISSATGQPRRAVAMVLADVFLYAASAVSIAAFCRSWWLAIHAMSFPHSSTLVELWKPRAGGWRSIVAVVLIALIAAATAAAPAIAAFNAWNGHKWSRNAGIFAVLIGCLGYLVGPLAWAAPLLSLVGTVILFLPPVTRYYSHWTRFRAGTPIPQRPEQPVVYGPAPRYLH